MRIGKIASLAIYGGFWVAFYSGLHWLFEDKSRVAQILTFTIVLAVFGGVLLSRRFTTIGQRVFRTVEAKLRIRYSPQFTVARVLLLIGIFAAWIAALIYLPLPYVNSTGWLVIWIAILIVMLNLLENRWTA